MRRIKKRYISLFLFGGLAIALEAFLKIKGIIPFGWSLVLVLMAWTLFFVDYLRFHFKLREIEKWQRHLAIKKFKDDWEEFQNWKKIKKQK